MAGIQKASIVERSYSILRRVTIKHRLLAAFLVTSLLPVVFVAFYSYSKYTESISHKLSASTEQTLSELSRNMTREINQYATLSESIIVNEVIQTGLPVYNSMSGNDRYQFLLKYRDAVRGQVFQASNVFNVVIFTNDGETVFDFGYESFQSEGLFHMVKAAANTPGNAHWAYLKSNRGTNLLTLSRVIYSERSSSEQIGYLMIMVEEKVFSRNTYRHVHLGTGSQIFLYNSQGLVISSTSSTIEAGKPYAYNAIFGKLASNISQGSFYTEIDHSKWLVTSDYVRSADWHLVGMLPESFLVSELSEMKTDSFMICIVTLLFSGLIAMLIYLSISSPMRRLLQYAKLVRLGQLETKLGRTHSDEMGKLAETIDQMVVLLKELISRVEAEQQAKRDAELKMLQAQINPHFLFNTLSSLKWSAMMSGNETVFQGMESLSELLRNTILEKEDLIPLEKEIGNLLHYATIQRIRYGDSFKLSCGMSDDRLYRYLVPKFILQPIVENSILHAGGKDGRRVKISVYGYDDGVHLRIRIADDGKGFDISEAYARRESNAKLSGIGIANVNERLNICFGPSYGLETRSKVGEGTETVITLPIVIEEGGEHV